MSEIAIGIAAVEEEIKLLPAEVAAIKFAFGLLSHIGQSIENRRAGTPTPLPVTGEQMWDVFCQMQKAQVAATQTT